ncbi:class F sortase, partial [Brachybacterium sp. p3-SID957]|uniref:class F sortase n=1 Tax=Brachybacterium sp. p3-SID957 TaxID=2916049 RepID=UPI00223B77FD
AGLALMAGMVLLSAGCAPRTEATETPGLEPTAPGVRPAVAAPVDPTTSPQAPTASEATTTAPTVPIVSTTTAAARKTPEPVSITVPILDASLPVEPTGVRADGQMDIPEDAAIAAWYRFGAAPGDLQGDTVIAAHVGSVQTPVGPLARLTDVRAGDEIVVTDSAGEPHAYRAVSVERAPKDGLGLTPYFSRTGPQRLVLITCGGRWLPDRGHYEDNIILVADVSA